MKKRILLIQTEPLMGQTKAKEEQDPLSSSLDSPPVSTKENSMDLLIVVFQV